MLTEQVARRKARKKRYGRCSELDRGTPRIRLNQKRSDAQVSQGRLAKLRAARLDSLGLAEGPLRSLSPGERTRAALICLFRRSPAVELLILDEPTYSLDLVGQRAMTEALRAWPGGLVIASHDRALLATIGVDTSIELRTLEAAPTSGGLSSARPPLFL